jgi:hypothetical protein
MCCTRPPFYRFQQAANGDDTANKAQGKKEDGIPAPAPGAPAKAAPGAPAPVDTPAGISASLQCRVTAHVCWVPARGYSTHLSHVRGCLIPAGLWAVSGGGGVNAIALVLEHACDELTSTDAKPMP